MPNNVENVAKSAIEELNRIKDRIYSCHPDLEYAPADWIEDRREFDYMFDVLMGQLVVLVEMEAQFRNEASNPR